MPSKEKETLRNDWTFDEVAQLWALPFGELVYRAQGVHRQFWPPDTVQASTLLSIKTGNCPEDCAYCPQSRRYHTGLETEPLADLDTVLDSARRAKEAGSTRFCMGAAWRSPKDRDMPALEKMVLGVKDLGLETCMTLGMLTPKQARRLADAGLDYYNHNLDTSPEFYRKIITTRSYQERLDTLSHVRDAGIKLCCGGILGMGETREDRIHLLLQLACLPAHPESVPINMLVRVAGTPLEKEEDLDPLEFICTLAVARILMPGSRLRLSAGREAMSDELQALAFLAGANSIFFGERLLTTANPEQDEDRTLLERLGIRIEKADSSLPGQTSSQAAC